MGEKDSNNNQDYSNVKIYLVPKKRDSKTSGGDFYYVVKSNDGEIFENIDSISDEQEIIGGIITGRNKPIERKWVPEGKEYYDEKQIEKLLEENRNKINELENQDKEINRKINRMNKEISASKRNIKQNERKIKELKNKINEMEKSNKELEKEERKKQKSIEKLKREQLEIKKKIVNILKEIPKGIDGLIKNKTNDRDDKNTKGEER